MSSLAVEGALALPESERGEALLAVSEDQWFEKKGPRVSEQALANVEVGLANADGGLIVVGIGADAVEGTDRYQAHRTSLMKAAILLVEPPIRVRTELVPCRNDAGESDRLLVIEVEAGETVHANQRDEVYLRVGDENRKLTFRERQELIFDKGQASFEATPLTHLSEDDLDTTLLKQYAAVLSHGDRLRLLITRNLMTSKGKLTAGGFLLFGINPQSVYPEAYVRVLRYKGTEKGAGRRQQLISDVRCEGPLPQQLTRAVAESEAVMPARRALGQSGRFERIGLIPKDAWLEGLVNAVVHRSYSLAGDHIRVEVFDDRIEIESPGRPPGLVNLDQPLNVTRFARNPRIARVCSDLDFGQELGEGIKRMFEEMRLAGLADPLYRQTEASVRLILVTAPVNPDLEARLPTRSRELLAILSQSGRMSTGDVADALGMSKPAALVRLNALMDVGLVEWVGGSRKDPRAFWRLPV